MASSGLRLRRVRFKDGRTIEVFRPKDCGYGPALKRTAQVAAEFAPQMAGYAVVVWKANGEVFVDYENGQQSPIPGGGVPQYVKDVLLAEVAVRWSKA